MPGEEIIRHDAEKSDKSPWIRTRGSMELWRIRWCVTIIDLRMTNQGRRVEGEKEGVPFGASLGTPQQCIHGYSVEMRISQDQ